jgi:hypothetical protein
VVSFIWQFFFFLIIIIIIIFLSISIKKSMCDGAN